MVNKLELFDFLKGLGFDGQQLETEVELLFKNMPATATIPFFKTYGEDQMRYDLKVEHDRQFQAYKLKSFLAIHREPIIIDHMVINGIDTAVLEQRMKREDWRDYFGKKLNYEHELDKAFVSETMLMLNKLSEGINFYGQKIQDELCFKYWPTEVYENDSKKDLQYLYENAREFSASPYGICNADLAYHITSGHLSQLHEQLTSTGLEQYPGIDLHSLLEFQLYGNHKCFEVSCSQDEPEGIIDYSIRVEQTDQGFEADKNHVCFRPYPEFLHGTYNGVDTATLEREMQQVNWKRDRLFEFIDDEAVLLTPIASIKDRLDNLLSDEKSAHIGEYLYIKYWSGESSVEGFVPDQVWEGFKNWPKIEHDFPIDFDARKIYNLMCERPIMVPSLGEYMLRSDEWIRMGVTALGHNGTHPIQVVPGLSMEQMQQYAAMLPLTHTTPRDIAIALANGERLPVTVSGARGEEEVFVEARLAQKEIVLFTKEGQAIPFNFGVEPNWKEGQRQQENKKMAAPIGQKKHNSRRKRRRKL